MSLDHLEAYHLAIELAKKAGFVLHHVSMNSETCYYEHPSRLGCFLRLSTHKNKTPIGIGGVAARLTLGRNAPHVSEDSVHKMMVKAVGEYFLRDAEPSKYDGPKLNGPSVNAPS